jgi:hypothetical protein
MIRARDRAIYCLKLLQSNLGDHTLLDAITHTNLCHAAPSPTPQIRDRDRAIHRLESLMRKLSADPNNNMQFVENSRWMGIFKETAFQVSFKEDHHIKNHGGF